MKTLLLLALLPLFTTAQLAPTSAPSVFGPLCPTELATMQSCLSANLNTNCEGCLGLAFNSVDAQECLDFDYALCPSLNECCSDCYDETLSYLECALLDAIGCELSCECIAEEFVVYDCLAANTTTEVDCLDCLTSYFPDEFACKDWQIGTCSALQACDMCSACVGDIETFFQCLVPFTVEIAVDDDVSFANSTCALDCASTVVCVEQEFAYAACLETNQPLTARACQACVGEALAPQENCNDYQTAVCGALEWTCAVECGECVADLLAFMDCTFQQLELDDCVPLDCRIGDQAVCGASQVALKECLNQELAENVATACDDCINQAIIRADTTSCDTLQSTMCVDLVQCGCTDRCSEQLANVTQCYADAVTLACTVDFCAGATAPPTPLITEPPSTAAPTPAPKCTDELTVLQDCILEANNSTDLCAVCLDASFQTHVNASLPFVVCDDVHTGLCPSFSGCGCGNCSKVIETYYRCELNEMTNDCNLDCDAFATNGAGSSSAWTSRRCSQPFSYVWLAIVLIASRALF